MQQRRQWLCAEPTQAGQSRRLLQGIHINAGGASTACALLYKEQGNHTTRETCRLQGDKDNTARRWSGVTKKTRFEEELNDYHEDTVMSSEDRLELWYSPYEIKILRDTARAYVKDMIKVEKEQNEALSYGGIFLQVYSRCCVLETATPATCPPVPTEMVSAEEARTLATWMSVASDRWGLERLSIRKIHNDRSSRRRRSVRVVLEVQNITDCLDFEARADYLRRAGEHISRPSTLFARLIANAREKALQRE